MQFVKFLILTVDSENLPVVEMANSFGAFFISITRKNNFIDVSKITKMYSVLIIDIALLIQTLELR